MSFSEKRILRKTSTEILTCVPPSLLGSESMLLSLCHCPRGNQQGHLPSCNPACHSSTWFDRNKIFSSRCEEVGFMSLRITFFYSRERYLPLKNKIHEIKFHRTVSLWGTKNLKFKEFAVAGEITLMHVNTHINPSKVPLLLDMPWAQSESSQR